MNDIIRKLVENNNLKAAIDKLKEFGLDRDMITGLTSQLNEIKKLLALNVNVEERMGKLRNSILIFISEIPIDHAVDHADVNNIDVYAETDEAFCLLDDMSSLSLGHYTIVDKYVRYRPPENLWRDIKDFTNNLLKSCTNASDTFENYLIYAAPATGKSFLLKQFWKTYGVLHNIKKIEVDMKETSLTDKSLKDKLRGCKEQNCPVFCIVDEIDSQPSFYPILHDAVELNKTQSDRYPNVVFAAVGSGGESLQGLRELMIPAEKGNDLQTRLKHGIEIPILSVGDRMLIVAQISRNNGIREIEKNVLHFIMTNDNLQTARSIDEWINETPLKNVEERCGSSNDKDLRFDDLFDATEQNIKIRDKYLEDFNSQFNRIKNAFVRVND